ncbi:MAG: hypothetical protein JO325_13935 [Solirubrobacterales bacterium]|nr:hypothetical protein [Solirubrobacterales bacterium]
MRGRSRALLTSRDALLVLHAVTTCATDATAFERLGHTFASVITGTSYSSASAPPTVTAGLPCSPGLPCPRT